jgi:hypothetical protein
LAFLVRVAVLAALIVFLSCVFGRTLTVLALAVVLALGLEAGRQVLRGRS